MGLFNIFGKKKVEKGEMSNIKVESNDINQNKHYTLHSVQFIKDFTSENIMASDLENIANQLQEGWKKNIILRDVRFSKWGKEGENNVYFELKNSFLPMLCLYDIRLEFKGYVAQYDFIVITNKFIGVIETKNLTGNIKITEDGSFIRQYTNSAGDIYKEEGIYSPITQNERHCRILEKFLQDKSLANNIPILPIVVLGNPRTIIDKTEASEEISNKLIRVDQLIKYLKDEIDNGSLELQNMLAYEISRTIKQNHKPITFKYIDKYSISEEDYIKIKKDKEILTQELKDYRLKKSRSENIKPYLVYNNAEMETLIEKYPKTKEDILTVKGFGEYKVNKYGDDILKIFNK